MANSENEQKCLFIGSKELGLSVLQCLVTANDTVDWLVIHPDDSHDARSVKDDFIRFCDSRDIPIVMAGSASQANEIMDTETFRFAMVCGWYWLLPDHLLESEGKRFYGIHNSLLPKYRGGAPLVWAIMNGDSVVGSSLFKLNAGMDAGNVVDQVTYNLRDSDTIAAVLDHLNAYWSQHIGSIFTSIIDGTAQESAQDETAASYCAQRIEDDGQINWHWPASRIHNFVRAQTRPYPCAFTINGRTKIHIVKTSLTDERIQCTPGQVIRRSASGVLIGCGDDTTISVLEAEIQGETTDLMSIFRSIKARLC